MYFIVIQFCVITIYFKNDEIKKTSLYYGLGNLWLFENNLINENSLAKRLKPLEKMNKIIV